mmetsp:Transcript_30648/g.69099  ORF Transcript_30648/g.69099 Transcript_30648/m.69099 type:complete len:222 (-) Transcript_30648:563-1228(-)
MSRKRLEDSEPFPLKLVLARNLELWRGRVLSLGGGNHTLRVVLGSTQLRLRLKDDHLGTLINLHLLLVCRNLGAAHNLLCLLLPLRRCNLQVTLRRRDRDIHLGLGFNLGNASSADDLVNDLLVLDLVALALSKHVLFAAGVRADDGLKLLGSLVLQHADRVLVLLGNLGDPGAECRRLLQILSERPGQRDVRDLHVFDLHAVRNELARQTAQHPLRKLLA